MSETLQLPKKMKTGISTSSSDSSEDEITKTPNDKSSDNKLPTSDKKSPEEKSPEEKSPEEKSPEEKSSEEKSPEKKSSEEKSTEEKSPEKKSSEKKSSEERSSEEKSSEKKSSEERSSEDESTEERSSEDESTEDESTEDKILTQKSNFEENLIGPIESSGEYEIPFCNLTASQKAQYSDIIVNNDDFNPNINEENLSIQSVEENGDNEKNVEYSRDDNFEANSTINYQDEVDSRQCDGIDQNYVAASKISGKEQVKIAEKGINLPKSKRKKIGTRERIYHYGGNLVYKIRNRDSVSWYDAEKRQPNTDKKMPETKEKKVKETPKPKPKKPKKRYKILSSKNMNVTETNVYLYYLMDKYGEDFVWDIQIPKYLVLLKNDDIETKKYKKILILDECQKYFNKRKTKSSDKARVKKGDTKSVGEGETILTEEDFDLLMNDENIDEVERTLIIKQIFEIAGKKDLEREYRKKNFDEKYRKKDTEVTKKSSSGMMSFFSRFKSKDNKKETKIDTIKEESNTMEKEKVGTVKTVTEY